MWFVEVLRGAMLVMLAIVAVLCAMMLGCVITDAVSSIVLGVGL